MAGPLCKGYCEWGSQRSLLDGDLGLLVRELAGVGPELLQKLMSDFTTLPVAH